VPRLSRYHEYHLSSSATKLGLLREKRVGSILNLVFFFYKGSNTCTYYTKSKNFIKIFTERSSALGVAFFPPIPRNNTFKMLLALSLVFLLILKQHAYVAPCLVVQF